MTRKLYINIGHLPFDLKGNFLDKYIHADKFP